MVLRAITELPSSQLLPPIVFKGIDMVLAGVNFATVQIMEHDLIPGLPNLSVILVAPYISDFKSSYFEI